MPLHPQREHSTPEVLPSLNQIPTTLNNSLKHWSYRSISCKQKSILLLLTCLLSVSSYGQKLIDSRQTSEKTYIYKITDLEAKKIYKSDLWKVDSTYFHTLIDSFPTDSLYAGDLAQGHYLKTYADKNKQIISITTIQDFDVFVFNNNTDLSIQVYDLQGKQIKDADVSARWKKLRFNKQTQSYLDKKSNQKGLLKVTHNGFTSYYDLSREYNNSGIKRGARKLIDGTPLKYAWVPVNYAISLPVDGAKSIINGWPQGTISITKNFFVKSYHKVACLFDDYYCDYYQNNRFRNRHTGYMVFNKPMYQPGDTVKFKAFVVTKKGKPIDKRVQVILQNNRKDIELTNLAPYAKGGYKYEFFLHDSMELQLDNNYTIRLELNDRKEYISGSFKYEDYELAKNKLTLRVDNREHFKNKELKLFAKGTDENELNLMDARLEILLTPKSLDKHFDNRLFIPDTLLFIKKKLDPVEETEVLLSDSTFPKANFDYSINVRLLTSDNESISEGEEIVYYYESQMFDIVTKTDSIHFDYLRNGVTEPKQVIIHSEDNFGNQSQVYEGLTPCKIELNPYYASYTIESDSLSESIDLTVEPSLLQCFSERTKDSVFIQVQNPRNIPFIYHIYKKNTQQTFGYTDSLNIQKKSTTRQNYYVSIRYLWGGKVREENYRIPLIDKKLNISVTQPKLIYPGQKSRIDLLVTDAEGNPVEGVDLTAYSTTKKFNYSAPQLPYLGKQRNRSVINNFTLKAFELNYHPGLQLDYNSWRTLAGIDSVEYYKFIYPKNTIYKSDYNTIDSITQFAPFVVSEGAIVPVHVIYVDNRPVYFSWSTNSQPYSFAVDSGYHQLKLRTTFREITMDSVYFEKGKKLIFSIDEDSQNPIIKTKKVEAKLSDYEKRLLYKYIVPYRNNFGEHYATIGQQGNIQLLNPKSKYKRDLIAGPYVGEMTYHLTDSFSTTFVHEPYFEYEFSPELLKMRSIDPKKYPEYLWKYDASRDLTDVVYTQEAIAKQWRDYLDAKRYQTAKYRYPNATSQGAGRLLVSFKKSYEPAKDLPLNVLVFRYDNHEFLRIYPGNTSYIHELQKGYHQLIYFYSGAKYHIEDSVYIQPNGLNYYEFEQPTFFKKDTFSVYVSNVIEETLFEPNPYHQNETRELKQIYNMYQQQFKHVGDGDIVEGYVYDATDGLPIPGVTIIVKNTNYGTVTDINGYYSIKVPIGNVALSYSFVGYNPEDRMLGNSVINVHLNPALLALEEVVVIGYGVQRKSDLTGSVATLTSGNLLGGIPGVSGNISQRLQGQVAGVSISSFGGTAEGKFHISIRGTSTPVAFEKTPLFIINGIVYMGDISAIDPSLIQNMVILKEAEATALYGARGVNGVVIVQTHPGAFKTTQTPFKGADFDETFLEAAGQSNSIRNNFADYAFWNPDLLTDKDGKASFEVVFPDDVTSWETFYLAMNGQRQSGQSEGLIKSYKPLMAQLALPRFLVQGDTSYVIGKVLNYSPDSIRVETKFEMDGIEMLNASRYCSNSLIDTLSVIAHNDSMMIKYYLETEEDYFDGEQREVPVFAKGLEATTGNFHVLNRDTTIALKFDAAFGEVSLYARADILEVLEEEISQLIKYKHSCNEQLASKLKALIAARNIVYFRGGNFKNDNEIERLIRLLKRNQKANGLWGWWKDSEESLWISLHVLEALTHAQLLGYRTSINKSQITELLIWELESSRDFNERLRILKILNLLEVPMNYQTYISDLERTKNINLNGLLNIIRLKQLCNINFNLDTLDTYKKTTLVGNVFYSDESPSSNLLNNDIQNTLLAYKIYKTDSISDRERLGKIRNYFLENRHHGNWRNTFESAQIIESILPDLLKTQSVTNKPKMTIKGDVNKTVTEFPFELQIDPAQNIEISKLGSYPVYLTSYQRYWNSAPNLKKEDFEIATSFDNKSTATLKAGQETKLIAKVTVKKDAEYVMINIPIPGGCSYADKKNRLRNETHREYFKNETTIFCDYLPKGEYTFEIDLISRFSGTYTINPAKVELMYFPTINANNEITTIKIN